MPSAKCRVVESQLRCRVTILHLFIMKMIMAVAKSHLTRDKHEEKLVVVKTKKYERDKIIEGQVDQVHCNHLMQ